jgi:rubrerythrin
MSNASPENLEPRRPLCGRPMGSRPPRRALRAARRANGGALDFFESVAASAKNAKVKKFAEEFMEEEAEHVNRVHRLMRRHPAPSNAWAADPDEPVAQD